MFVLCRHEFLLGFGVDQRDAVSGFHIARVLLAVTTHALVGPDVLDLWFRVFEFNGRILSARDLASERQHHRDSNHREKRSARKMTTLGHRVHGGAECVLKRTILAWTVARQSERVTLNGRGGAMSWTLKTRPTSAATCRISPILP